MILEMKVPSPGESISEVEIAQWLVANGDYVELYIYPYVDSVNGLGAGGSPSGVDSHLAIFRLAD